MEIIPDLLCLPFRDPGDSSQLFRRCRDEILNRRKTPHQSLFAGGSDTGDRIEAGGDLRLAAEGTVVLDGKAVRLVLDTGDELEALPGGVDRQFFVVEKKSAGAVAVILDHPADRDLEAELIQHRGGDIDLAPAAVHQDKIREAGEAPQLRVEILLFHLPLFVHAVLKPAHENFTHAGVVVGAGHRPDAEFPVVAAPGLSVLENDHRADIGKAADIGDVVGLHAPYGRQPQKRGDLLYRADGAPLLAPQALPVLLEDERGVFARELDELLFFPFFRDKKRDPAAAAGAEPLLQKGVVLRLRGQEDLPGHEGRRRVELFDEFGEDRPLGLPGDVGHVVVLAAHELPVPDEKDLHDAVRIRILLLDGDAQDVPVLTDALGHLLLLGHLLHALQKVAPADRLLEAQLLRGLLHLLRQVADDRLVVAGQKFQGHVDPLPVILLRDIPRAGPAAAVHVKIQAGPVLPEIPGQDAVTVPEPVHPVDELDRLPHRLRAGKRPEIPGLILLHLPGKQDARIGLPHRHLDVGVGLVVLEHRVVLRAVLLDQVVFQDQRLQLRIRHDILKARDLLHHPVDLRPSPDDLPEIGADAVVEVHRLAHVNDRVLRVVHDIDPGLCRQFFEFLRKIRHVFSNQQQLCVSQSSTGIGMCPSVLCCLHLYSAAVFLFIFPIIKRKQPQGNLFA